MRGRLLGGAADSR